MLLFSNNSETTLAAELLADPGALSITASGDGSALTFPAITAGSGEMLATLTNETIPGAYEIVTITQHDGVSFSVDRAAEETTLRAWPAGTKMSARVTAGMLRAISGGPPEGAKFSVGASIVMSPGDATYPGEAESSQPYSFVVAGRSRLSGVSQISMPSVLQLENGGVGSQYYGEYQDINLAYPSIGGTFAVDLGVPPVWQAITLYPRGSVVSPTVPNGKQYWAETEEIARTMQSGPDEPNWLEGAPEDGPAAPEGTWRPTLVPISFTQTTFHPLVVTEVGFIAHKANAATLPRISIGTPASPTMFAGNIELTQITGDGCIHRIPIASGGPMVNAMQYTVDTAATGGQFLGRFYWRGFFVELMTP